MIEVRPFQREDREQVTALVNAHVQTVVPGVFRLSERGDEPARAGAVQFVGIRLWTRMPQVVEL